MFNIVSANYAYVFQPFIFHSSFLTTLYKNILVCGQTPLIERYTSEDVPPISSVFFIHQDKQGYLYISSGGSTYLYNGKIWELIRGLNSVRSGINDNDGTVLLGLDDGMGYLEIQLDGTRKYIPLTDQLTDDEKKMSTIWNIHKTNEGIFFRSQHYVFHFQKINGKYKKIKSYPYHYIVLSYDTPSGFFFSSYDTTSNYEMIQTIQNGANKSYPNACFATFSHKKDSTLLIVPTYGGVQLTRIQDSKFNHIGFIVRMTSLSFQNPFPHLYLYLLSDGLQDQFGGTQGKKFGLNNIRKLLVSMSKNAEIAHQKTILESTFQEWAYAHEQVDDIAVLGVKIVF